MMEKIEVTSSPSIGEIWPCFVNGIETTTAYKKNQLSKNAYVTIS